MYLDHHIIKGISMMRKVLAITTLASATVCFYTMAADADDISILKKAYEFWQKSEKQGDIQKLTDFGVTTKALEVLMSPVESNGKQHITIKITPKNVQQIKDENIKLMVEIFEKFAQQTLQSNDTQNKNNIKCTKITTRIGEKEYYDYNIQGYLQTITSRNRSNAIYK
jgi:hypothetical protein